MLTPLNKHFDLGFGAMGNSFKGAADAIFQSQAAAPYLNAHLPASFLYRHAIELFLKSSIVILHKKLKLPFGSGAHSSEPQVLIGGKWKPIFNVHSLIPLNSYTRDLFSQHEDSLKKLSDMDWSVQPEFTEWIKTIDATDSTSTFFRYPVTKNHDRDRSNSVIKEDSYLNIMARMGPGHPPQKAFFVFNENDELAAAFHQDDTSSIQTIKTLREASNLLYGFHAAMRHELTGGW